ncbi:hypothetical protein [Streptomyces parvus]|uniref:hypothetical protein n=1 Tax=Streptomyces parvus TaxID=66428 RepID=UPI00406BD5FC
MTESAEPRARRTHILADLTPLRTSPDYRRLWFGNTVSWIGQGMTALVPLVGPMLGGLIVGWWGCGPPFSWTGCGSSGPGRTCG